MSAPPIGITTKKPNNIEITTIVQKIIGDWLITNKTIRKRISRKINALIRCWNLNTKGLPEIVPCNFPKAYTEPEKVIAPINVPILISTKLAILIDPILPILKATGS